MTPCPPASPRIELAPDSPLLRPGFLFGAATAAYQIEGATLADGRLPSIWDTFCATPGKVLNGDSGEVACDHYHRWDDDVTLMKTLGLDAYRLSIAWPRVVRADGLPNVAGIGFYRRLLARLKSAGIQTFVTLYHWDLPQHLQDRGGWLNRDTAHRFADYAGLMARELRGLVSAWTTLNEPWCSAYLGHGLGVHAPGVTDIGAARQAMHHLLLGHGLAVARLREFDPGTPCGLVSVTAAVTADTLSTADRTAAGRHDAMINRWVLDALLKGRYPSELDDLWPGTAPVTQASDAACIATPLDYVGINYYFRSNVRSDGAHGVVDAPLPDVERTQMGWQVDPDGLRDLLVRFKADYPGLPPLYITENGLASDDAVVEGQVHDDQRIRYLTRHFNAVGEAMQAGVDLRGYFVWSLLDNFEWAYGYERRFGLVHVDYATQARTWKDSAKAYQALLAGRTPAAAA